MSLGFAAIALMGWLWYTRIEPYRLYLHAQREFTGNPKRAAELLEAAVNRSGGIYPEAQLLWSRTFLRLGQPQDALGCFSVISNPGEVKPEQLLDLASEARKAGEDLLARLALEAVPASSPMSIEAIHQRMELALLGGRYQDVQQLGTQLLEHQPDDPLRDFLVAQAQEQSGDPQSAAQYYLAALRVPNQLNPDRVVFGRRRLLRLAIQLGDNQLARECLSDLKERTSLSHEDRLHQAELLRLEGDTDAAWAEISELLKERPRDLAVRMLHATLGFDRRQDQQAEGDLRVVLQAQPWNKAAHYTLAQILQRTNRNAEAEKHYRENRRLTELSIRVLELQQSAFPEAEREQARLRELADALSALGQLQSAEQIRAQLRRSN